MSTHDQTDEPTLADLIARVEADPTTAEATCREMTSAIRTVAKVLRSEPHLLPANPAALRPLINSALPLGVGVSATRWRNAKSLLRKAFGLIDRNAMPARSRAGLLGEWSLLLDDPAAKSLSRGLSRFTKYCSGRGIAPDAVTQGIFDEFLADLNDHCLVRSPQETQQTAGHAWNAAVAAVPGWPQLILTMTSRRKNPSLSWSAFPATLYQDVEAYLTPRSADQFDFSQDTPVMRASTIATKQRAFRQFVTAVVEGGVDPAALRTLADVIRPETAQKGLQVLLDRAGGQITGRIETTAYLLLGVARHWSKPYAPTIERLELFVRNLSRKQRGMTPKNRKRLQQFEDPRQVDLLLGLPVTMMAEALRVKQPTAAEARAAQHAVAIEILTVAPLRISNVAGLELGRTLHLDGRDRGHILLDHTEVKNDLDLEVPLPVGTVRMIQTYLKVFHPLLAPAGCRMLFPSADGGHKRSVVLSDQISKCIGRRIGLKMNAHLFRHLAAKIFLELNPGAYGIVKLLLGHKSIETTMRIYCGTEHAAAYRAWDQLLAAKRGASHTGSGRIGLAQGVS